MKSALSTRWAQMSKQEQIIEKKKQEIQAKLEAQKQAAAIAAQAKLINPPVSQEEKKTANNIFSNDGSFLKQYKQLLEKQKKEKTEKDSSEKKNEQTTVAKETKEQTIVAKETKEQKSVVKETKPQKPVAKETQEHKIESKNKNSSLQIKKGSAHKKDFVDKWTDDWSKSDLIRAEERSRDRNRSRWSDKGKNKHHSPSFAQDEIKMPMENREIPSMFKIPFLDDPPASDFNDRHEWNITTNRDMDDRDARPGVNEAGPNLGARPGMALFPNMGPPPIGPGPNMGPIPHMGPRPNTSSGPNMDSGHNMCSRSNLGFGPNIGLVHNMGPGAPVPPLQNLSSGNHMAPPPNMGSGNLIPLQPNMSSGNPMPPPPNMGSGNHMPPPLNMGSGNLMPPPPNMGSGNPMPPPPNTGSGNPMPPPPNMGSGNPMPPPPNMVSGNHMPPPPNMVSGNHMPPPPNMGSGNQMPPPPNMGSGIQMPPPPNMGSGKHMAPPPNMGLGNFMARPPNMGSGNPMPQLPNMGSGTPIPPPPPPNMSSGNPMPPPPNMSTGSSMPPLPNMGSGIPIPSLMNMSSGSPMPSLQNMGSVNTMPSMHNMGSGPNITQASNINSSTTMSQGSNMGQNLNNSQESKMGPGPMGPGFNMGPMPPFSGASSNFPPMPPFMAPSGPDFRGPLPSGAPGTTQASNAPPMPQFFGPPFPSGPPSNSIMPPNSMNNPGRMPFMPPFGPNGPNFPPNFNSGNPSNMPFMPSNTMSESSITSQSISDQKSNNSVNSMANSESTKMPNSSQPMPLLLKHIPKPTDMDRGGIRPPPPPPPQPVLSADSLPPPVRRFAEEVARNGDHWENVMKPVQSQENMWFHFLHNTNSNEYKMFREVVMKLRQDMQNKQDIRPEDKYEPEFSLEDEDSNEQKPVKQENFRESYNQGDYPSHWDNQRFQNTGYKREAASSQSDDEDHVKERHRRKKKSRWSNEPPVADIKPPGMMAPLPPNFPPGMMPPMPPFMPPDMTATSTSSKIPSLLGPLPPLPGMKLAKIDEEGMKLTNLNRSNPALMQYAMTNYGTTNLSVEDWKKCEDNFKLNLLYQDMLKKRQQVEKLAAAGRNKYEYDSDEDTREGTWEHRLRSREMSATEKWANELTKQAAGKHHIGDFLPPEELKKFMEKYSAAKSGHEPNLSDYKEFKLKEDNVGFKMLQKLGWNEGQGLGADGSGIVDPVNKANQPVSNLGLGAAGADTVSAEDDEFDAYRKRMMLAYRFRPNPLNNPRRPYY